MANKYIFSLLTFFGLAFATCFISCGSHGFLKGYQYPVKKEILQKAVMMVIKNNTAIYRDTAVEFINDVNAPADSLAKHPDHYNSYNDGEEYVTIKITSGQQMDEFTFGYFGDEDYWKKSNSSEIFICFAFDKNHYGGSEGTGGISGKMRKEFTSLFEKELVTKVDQELHIGHVDIK